MEVRLYIDETGKPHIAKHGVREEEVVAFFDESVYIEVERNDGSFEAYGLLQNGRPLKVAFRKTGKNEVFIITAHEFDDKEIINILEDRRESN